MWSQIPGPVWFIIVPGTSGKVSLPFSHHLGCPLTWYWKQSSAPGIHCGRQSVKLDLSQRFRGTVNGFPQSSFSMCEKRVSTRWAYWCPAWWKSTKELEYSSILSNVYILKDFYKVQAEKRSNQSLRLWKELRFVVLCFILSISGIKWLSSKYTEYYRCF